MQRTNERTSFDPTPNEAQTRFETLWCRAQLILQAPGKLYITYKRILGERN